MEVKPGTNHLQKPQAIQAEVNPYKEVAQAMEEQFVYELIKEMKKSVPQNQPKSTGESFYESLQDQERAKIIAQQGLGIQELILDQIQPKSHKGGSHE